MTSFNFEVFAFAFEILFASEPLRISLKYIFEIFASEAC